MPPSLFSLEYHVAEIHRLDEDRRVAGHADQVRRAGGRGSGPSLPSLRDVTSWFQGSGTGGRVAAH